MSRSSPNISGWCPRAKRYGGWAALEQRRVRQLGQLNALVPFRHDVEPVIDWLEANPRRVLSDSSEIHFGLRVRPQLIGDAPMDDEPGACNDLIVEIVKGNDNAPLPEPR